MRENLAKVHAAELDGIQARPIEIEVDVNVGLHAFTIVGLADKAVKESEERINSALKNTGIKPPSRENRRITVNLAPADLKKAGSQYDLAISLGYLSATHQVGKFDADRKMFLGELALDGRLRPISGALNIAEMAKSRGFEFLFLPSANANEAAVVKGLTVVPLNDLNEAIEILEGRAKIVPKKFAPLGTKEISAPDFSEIKGQENAKRALTISASGGHNVLMIGPPGVGKSLLAQALVGILPSLNLDESIEVTKIWSAAGLSPQGLLTQRPFRSPHQTASLVSVVGGGSDPKPGEISLAHRGVLFLDEVPEFPKNILESLRQPLEAGIVHISRAKTAATFPAKFALVAAMNPCPCGFYGDPEKECRCTAYEVIRYQKKISGPLLDRIDIQIRVPRVELKELREKNLGAGASAATKKKVEEAREIQRERFKNMKIRTNSEMSSAQTEKFVELSDGAEKFLGTLEKARLSPRGFYRLLKTSRTIADLEASAKVREEHLAEAFSYRLKEEV